VVAKQKKGATRGRKPGEATEGKTTAQVSDSMCLESGWGIAPSQEGGRVRGSGKYFSN
jgi:hypothetical protein